MSSRVEKIAAVTASLWAADMRGSHLDSRWDRKALSIRKSIPIISEK